MHYLVTYVLFFFGIFLEGELILLSGVIAAHQGLMNIWFVIGLTITATILSDVLYYNLGKHKAEKWLSKSRFAQKYENVKKRLISHRTKMLYTYRFLYGMRIITPFVLGTEQIPIITFLKYSIISTVIWCLVFVGLGYVFGEVIINNLKHIQKIEYYIIGSLIIIAVIFLIIKLIKKNEQEN